MDEPSIEQRVNRLEREVRWWRVLGCAALLGVAAAVVMGQARPAKVIEAEKFVLRDTSGKTRAGLRVMPDGAVGLFLTDRDENICVRLSVSPDGAPSLGFWETGVELPRVTLGIMPDRTTGLLFTDRASKIRAWLTVSPEGSPELRFSSRDDKDGVCLGLSPDDASFLGLYDKRGNARIKLAVRPEGTPFLSLFETDGSIRASLALWPDGSPGVALYDQGGENRAELGLAPDGLGSLEFRNSAGTTLWSAP